MSNETSLETQLNEIEDNVDRVYAAGAASVDLSGKMDKFGEIIDNMLLLDNSLLIVGAQTPTNDSLDSTLTTKEYVDMRDIGQFDSQSGLFTIKRNICILPMASFSLYNKEMRELLLINDDETVINSSVVKIGDLTSGNVIQMDSDMIKLININNLNSGVNLNGLATATGEDITQAVNVQYLNQALEALKSELQS